MRIATSDQFNSLQLCRLERLVAMSQYNNRAVVEQPKATDHQEDNDSAEGKEADFVGSKHVDGGECKECCCVTLKLCGDVKNLLRSCL